jgi:hypothetical protein
MPTTPQPPARPAPQQQQPPRQAQPQAAPNPPATGRPPAATFRSGEAPTGRATVGPAQTFPPGSRYNRDVPQDGPDPQESKMRPYELAATRAQEEPVRTAAQEQRERSAEYEERGVEVVKAEGDTRDPRARPRTVPGVSRTQIDADEVDRVQRNRS